MTLILIIGIALAMVAIEACVVLKGRRRRRTMRRPEKPLPNVHLEGPNGEIHVIDRRLKSSIIIPNVKTDEGPFPVPARRVAEVEEILRKSEYWSFVTDTMVPVNDSKKPHGLGYAPREVVEIAMALKGQGKLHRMMAEEDVLIAARARFTPGKKP